jgi:hypothetical protein
MKNKKGKKIILYLTKKALKEMGEILYKLATGRKILFGIPCSIPVIVGDKIELTINSVNGERKIDIFIISEEFEWKDIPEILKTLK